jgi:antitoxin component HigA of HigAB toxin-antitoxin module
MNPSGEVLLELLEARGMSVADLAEIIRARSEACEVSGEDIL